MCRPTIVEPQGRARHKCLCLPWQSAREELEMLELQHGMVQDQLTETEEELQHGEAQVAQLQVRGNERNRLPPSIKTSSPRAV